MRKISRVNFRDVQALNGLRLCGYALRSDMERIISCNRIKTLLKQGYIEAKKDVHGQEVLTYTAKGKSFIKQLGSLQGRTFYPKQANAIAHDTTLFRQYTLLSPEERMSALSETETRDQFREALDQMRSQADEAWASMRHSIPDLVYTSNEGETVALEITTSNYTQDKIEAKMAVAVAIGAELQTIRI